MLRKIFLRVLALIPVTAIAFYAMESLAQDGRPDVRSGGTHADSCCERS